MGADFTQTLVRDDDACTYDAGAGRVGGGKRTADALDCAEQAQPFAPHESRRPRATR